MKDIDLQLFFLTHHSNMTIRFENSEWLMVISQLKLSANSRC